MVNLNGKFTIPNIPSKTMDYFEMSIPILACVDKNTDYGEFFWEVVPANTQLLATLKLTIKTLCIFMNQSIGGSQLEKKAAGF